jgi:TetR/AcrR family transcriptional repressor of nem operon
MGNKKEVQVFADVNVKWLKEVLQKSGVKAKESEQRARGIFAAIMGAQLMARSNSSVSVFDTLIDTYRSAGLIPTSSR